MTLQEAEMWAARLGRIWGTHKPCQGEVALSAEGNCQWWTALERGVEVEVVVCGQEKLEIDLKHYPSGLYRRCGHLSYESNTIDEGIIAGKLHCAEDEFAQFAARWLAFFRRSCWLSGCSIEASAHEKAEWLRGFAREEVEAWNLKF